MNYVTPGGFRDILPEEALLREEIATRVQACFADKGYAPLETPTLEVMDVLRAGGRIPVSPFKFFDSQGDLLAMRPDVTMQVARICATRLKNNSGSMKFRYMQRVFREADREMKASTREMTQFGVENIGEKSPSADAELLSLFAEALEVAGLSSFTLVIGTVGVLRSLLEASGAEEQWCQQILEAYHSSNFVELDTLVANSSISLAFAEAIRSLPRIRGGHKAIEQVRRMVEPLGCLDGLDTFEETYSIIEERGLADKILIDFSVMSSFDYYTGIVFEAYAPGLGSPLGSGGRYDNMLGAYGLNRPAAGFAFSLESVMSVLSDTSANQSVSYGSTSGKTEKPLRIAIPKGSLYPDSLRALEAAGLATEGLDDPGRQLIIRNKDVEYIIVRPTDAPIFVALGAADCGMCGKDSLLEADADVVELADLKYGACRFVVAEPEGFEPVVNERYQKLGSIRVATKYPRITQAYYAQTGIQVEVVKLHGNIELAPLTGMAERIVDITATGTTLRENKLEIVDDVLSSTARFFANVSSFRLDARVAELAEKFQEAEEIK